MRVTTLSVAQINALRHKDPSNYESHRNTIAKVNELIAAGKDSPLAQTALVLSDGFGPDAQHTLAGGAKRGTINVTVGTTALGVNPTIALNFPANEFDSPPFAVVARASGTGALGYVYTVSAKQLVVTLNGTVLAGETYVFSYMVSD